MDDNLIVTIPQPKKDTVTSLSLFFSLFYLFGVAEKPCGYLDRSTIRRPAGVSCGSGLFVVVLFV